MQQVADDVANFFSGKALRGIHCLPDALTPFLAAVEAGERVDMQIGLFQCKLREIFEQGRIFMDAQAAHLAPFVSAMTLLAKNEKNQWEGIAPFFGHGKTDESEISLEREDVQHFLIGTLEKGMAHRAKEMLGYSHYFVSAVRDDRYVHIVTEASNPNKIGYLLNDEALKKDTWTVEPFVTHRLSPDIQAYLSLAESLNREREKYGATDGIPSVPFNEAQFQQLTQNAYSEGWLIYERHKGLHPPRAFPADSPAPDPEIVEAEKHSIFARASDQLLKEKITHLNGNALINLITGFLYKGRDDAWKKDVLGR